jgi:hypothetical protein
MAEVEDSANCVFELESLPPVEIAWRLYLGLEMQAAIMRDPQRTGGWKGAERVASAFERQARVAKRLHDALASAAA